VAQGNQAKVDRLWTSPIASTLQEAITYTLAYADVFGYPLTLPELHRYLIGFDVTPGAVAAALRDTTAFPNTNGYYTLPGRTSLVALRQRREEVAKQLWPFAMKYGRSIARLPFVRMVALTGALPLHNVEPGDDLDYLIVTTSGHVWITRLLVVQLVVKPAARRGHEVCPNFLLAEHALAIEEHDLFHAHELTQMVPIYGLGVYEAFRAANPWTAAFLPNASGPPRVDLVADDRPRAYRTLVELPLRGPIGPWIERREIGRMRVKLRSVAALRGVQDMEELLLSPDQCKGHIRPHGRLTQTAFAARLDKD
jgi:hypothetical protein